MESYIISLTVCSLAAAFICIAAPEKSGINKFVSFLAALIVTTAIVFPFILDFDFNFTTETDVIVNDTNEDHKLLAAKSLAYSISSSAEDRFNIKVKNVFVNVLDESDFVVEKVTVILDGSYQDLSVVSEYLSQLYNCKIDIEEE